MVHVDSASNNQLRESDLTKLKLPPLGVLEVSLDRTPSSVDINKDIKVKLLRHKFIHDSCFIFLLLVLNTNNQTYASYTIHLYFQPTLYLHPSFPPFHDLSSLKCSGVQAC